MIYALNEWGAVLRSGWILRLHKYDNDCDYSQRPEIFDFFLQLLFSWSYRPDTDTTICYFCKELSPAYTYSRYPDVPEIVEIMEVSRNLLQYAKEVLNWVERRL